MLRTLLTERHSDIRFITEDELPKGTYAIDTEATADQVIAQGADAVIIGNAA